MPIVSTTDNPGNPPTAKTWQALMEAARLVGRASELDGIPDDLRAELIDTLANLTWTAQSIRCPLCGSWRNKGGNQ
jgi:hypothetical protein